MLSQHTIPNTITCSAEPGPFAKKSCAANAASPKASANFPSEPKGDSARSSATGQQTAADTPAAEGCSSHATLLDAGTISAAAAKGVGEITTAATAHSQPEEGTAADVATPAAATVHTAAFDEQIPTGTGVLAVSASAVAVGQQAPGILQLTDVYKSDIASPREVHCMVQPESLINSKLDTTNHSTTYEGCWLELHPSSNSSSNLVMVASDGFPAATARVCLSAPVDSSSSTMTIVTQKVAIRAFHKQPGQKAAAKQRSSAAYQEVRALRLLRGRLQAAQLIAEGTITRTAPQQSVAPQEATQQSADGSTSLARDGIAACINICAGFVAPAAVGNTGSTPTAAAAASPQQQEQLSCAVLEWCPNDVSQILEQYVRLSEFNTKVVAEGVVQLLQAMQSGQLDGCVIVHGGLKLKNVRRRTSDQTIAVTGFEGCNVYQLAATGGKEGSSSGSSNNNSAVLADAARDVVALGLMVWEMLLGRLPHLLSGDKLPTSLDAAPELEQKLEQFVDSADDLLGVEAEGLQVSAAARDFIGCCCGVGAARRAAAAAGEPRCLTPDQLWAHPWLCDMAQYDDDMGVLSDDFQAAGTHTDDLSAQLLADDQPTHCNHCGAELGSNLNSGAAAPAVLTSMVCGMCGQSYHPYDTHSDTMEEALPDAFWQDTAAHCGTPSDPASTKQDAETAATSAGDAACTTAAADGEPGPYEAAAAVNQATVQEDESAGDMPAPSTFAAIAADKVVDSADESAVAGQTPGQCSAAAHPEAAGQDTAAAAATSAGESVVDAAAGAAAEGWAVADAATQARAAGVSEGDAVIWGIWQEAVTNSAGCGRRWGPCSGQWLQLPCSRLQDPAAPSTVDVYTGGTLGVGGFGEAYEGLLVGVECSSNSSSIVQLAGSDELRCVIESDFKQRLAAEANIEPMPPTDGAASSITITTQRVATKTFKLQHRSIAGEILQQMMDREITALKMLQQQPGAVQMLEQSQVLQLTVLPQPAGLVDVAAAAATATAAAAGNATLDDSYSSMVHEETVQCVVMDWFPMDLSKLMRLLGRPPNTWFSEHMAKDIIKQLVGVLHTMHSGALDGQKVIHCDLKPANILIRLELNEGCINIHVAVADFGSCKIVPQETAAAVAEATQAAAAADAAHGEAAAPDDQGGAAVATTDCTDLLCTPGYVPMDLRMRPADGGSHIYSGCGDVYAVGNITLELLLAPLRRLMPAGLLSSGPDSYEDYVAWHEKVAAFVDNATDLMGVRPPGLVISAAARDFVGCCFGVGRAAEARGHSWQAKRLTVSQLLEHPWLQDEQS